ncbi:MAG: Asp-tRNA(Asn)/Glu-tRNA(Gln) amidotransferase subunit GatB [Candidatus Diapherotrites archaeon]
MTKIGLEVHVQLNTLSKLFCACPTKSVEPNTAVCEVCLGFPGSKPVLNKKAVNMALLIALALNCEVNRTFFFSRKSYFYPDLAKNFQITQYEFPVGSNGFLFVDGVNIGIRRVHLEEDPASLVHGDGFSLVDYNRSGVPLVEIVTEPVIQSPLMARHFLDSLVSILDYLGVYDSDFVLKADCNISVDGVNRVEVKNVTGFRSVQVALEYELKRQSEEISLGRKVLRETRGFDEVSGKTYSLRSKEFEEDYGYIYEPDLVSVFVDDAWLKDLKGSLPELASERAKRLVKEYGIKEYDAKVICLDKGIADIFEACAKIDVRIAVRLVSQDLVGVLNFNKLSLRQTKVSAVGICALARLIKDNLVSERNSKQALIKYVLDGILPEDYLRQNNLLIGSSFDLVAVVNSVLAENDRAFKDFKGGSVKALNFLVGAVLKKVQGKADAREVKKLIESRK